MAFGCGSSHAVVAQPSPVIEDPTVSCPADIAVTAHSGQTPTVSFDTPSALNGSAPVTVVCTPASGTPFGNGTTVTCEATDSRAHKASCRFDVVVTPVPQLSKTRFLAFGDSITEGKTALLAPSILTVPPGTFNASGSYPELLNAKLSTRYQDQTITMVAYGLGKEQAGEGKLRLRDGWASFNPDSLLLLEGVNDLTLPDSNTPAGMASAIDSVIDALRADISVAKGHGARTYLATLLPMTPPLGANVVAAVPTLNGRIRSLAVEQGVTLVDLNAAVPASLIGADGIHPKSQAYDIMADEWLKAIIATLEVKASSLP